MFGRTMARLRTNKQRELPLALAPTSRRALEAARRLRRARTRGRPVVVQLPDGVLSGAVGRVARTAGIAGVGEDVVRLRDVVSIRETAAL